MKAILTVLALAVALFMCASPAGATSDTLKAVEAFVYEKCLIEFPEAKAREKARYYAPMIVQAARKHDLPPKLVASIIWFESNYHPRRVSHAGALGLMQVMPFHFKKGEDWRNPRTNLDVGCRVLKSYHVRFNGDWHRTLTAYNFGPTRVSRGGLDRSRYSRKVLGALKGAQH